MLGAVQVEQAVKEAQSKYQSYIDRGYEADLATAPVANQVFRPMLAHSYDKRGKDIVFPAWAQHKIDGVRVLLSYLSRRALSCSLAN